MIEPAKLQQFAIVTPSCRQDFERCRLLVESIQKYSRSCIHHYIIVEDENRPLFDVLAGPNTEIVSTESLFPEWSSLKLAMINGWILQQLIKIAFARNASEEVVMFVDSDTVFIRPFDTSCFERNGRVRLFRVADFYDEGFEPWYATVNRILGLPDYQSGTRQANFIGNLITWKTEHVSPICTLIENNLGQSWGEALSTIDQLSEYILYGTFVDNYLGDESGHFRDCTPLCHEYWSPVKLDDTQLQAFFDSINPEAIAVMISSKAGIEPQFYRAFLDVTA